MKARDIMVKDHDSLFVLNEGTLSSVTSLLRQKCAYHVGPNEL